MGSGNNKKNRGHSKRASGTKPPKQGPATAESMTTNDEERSKLRPDRESREQELFEGNNDVQGGHDVRENGERRENEEPPNTDQRSEMVYSGDLENGSKHSTRSRETSSSRNPLRDIAPTLHHRHQHSQQHKSPAEDIVPLLQVMEVRDVNAAIEAWDKTRLELESLRKQVQVLEGVQKEALNFVDRFHPKMDSEFQGGFLNLNAAIGSLVKDKTFLGLTPKDPLRGWDSGAFFAGAINPELRKDLRVITESQDRRVYLKLLLYQRVWKFLDEKLFDSSKPFGAYSNVFVVDKYVHNAFCGLFYPDTKRDSHLPPYEEAARWRSSTVARLNALDDEKGQQRKLQELTSEFFTFVHEKVGYGKKEKDVKDLFESEAKLGPCLRAVLDTAVGLARLMARQRAHFCLEMPDLDLDSRMMDPKRMTTLGSTGVRVGNSDEDDGEAEGEVMFCASPMLVKWGNGQGKNFNEGIILVKSFVQVFPEKRV